MSALMLPPCRPALLAALFGIAGSAGAQSITVIAPPPGYQGSGATAVSGDGRVVVGSFIDSFSPNHRAFVWTAETGAVQIGNPPGATSTLPKSVSYDGAVVVGVTHLRAGFRWTLEAGFQDLAPLQAPAVSADGAVIVGSIPNPWRGFRWTPAQGLQQIQTGPYMPSEFQALAASANGAVIVGCDDAAPLVVSGPTGTVRLTVPPGMPPPVSAVAVSGDGAVLIGQQGSTSPGEGCRCTLAAGCTRLPPAAGHSMFTPFATNSDGSVIVGRGSPIEPPFGFQAVIWTTARGTETLADYLAAHGIVRPGLLYMEALGVSADGRTIVGVGWEQNRYRAFIATISPCGNSDFNGYGDYGTDQDIEAFFACLGGNCCPACWMHGADFNGDGDTGTDQDIEAFFRVLGGGAC